MSVVLDTDHCVAILRGRLDVGRHVVPSEPLFVTVITVAELAYGAHRSARPEHNLLQLERLLGAVTVLDFDPPAALRFGAMKAALRERGRSVADPDLQIGCIALEHALPVATHNQRHFRRIEGLSLVDWLAG